MIAAVFVCMVFLQAAINDQGPAFACLTLVEANEVALHVSPAVLAEVREVLTRPEIQAKFPHLTPDRVDIFLQKVANLAILLSNVPDSGFPIRDPDDLPYFNLAVAANVEYIVTRDKDLLDLMNDPTFVGRFPRLQILDPAAFLTAARLTKR